MTERVKPIRLSPISVIGGISIALPGRIAPTRGVDANDNSSDDDRDAHKRSVRFSGLSVNGGVVADSHQDEPYGVPQIPTANLST